MIVTRYWRDADGRARQETAGWLPVPEGTEGAVQLPPELLAASDALGPGFTGWVVPAGVTAPAPDPAAVAAAPASLYELELQAGAALLTADEYLEAQETEASALRDAQAAVDAQLAAQAASRAADRRAAIEAFAAAAGVPTDVAETLIGAL